MECNLLPRIHILSLFSEEKDRYKTLLFSQSSNVYDEYLDEMITVVRD
jgi:hypothetical protein